MYREQLQKFTNLIRPIANALESPPDDGANPGEARTETSGAKGETRRAVQDRDGFFTNATGDKDVTLHSSDAQPPNPGFEPGADQAPRRRLDALKQTMLENRIAAFAQLAPAQQALARVGAMLLLHRDDYVQRVYHFLHLNVLVAVLDRPAGLFYMRKELAASDYSDMQTVVRPDAAGASSTLFEKIPVLDAVWAYAQHDPEAMLDLPAELATSWLRLRALPTVSPRVLRHQHMAVISRLLTRDQHMGDLIHGKSQEERSDLVDSLACLLLTRSVVLTQEPMQSLRNLSAAMQKKRAETARQRPV